MSKGGVEIAGKCIPFEKAPNGASFRSEWRTAFQLIDSVWCPVSFCGSMHVGDRLLESMDLSFSWRGLNQAIAPILFEVEGLRFRENYIVADNRGQRAFVLGIIGPDHKFIDLMAPPPPASKSYWPVLTWAVAGLFAILAVVALAWWWFRRPLVTVRPGFR